MLKKEGKKGSGKSKRSICDDLINHRYLGLKRLIHLIIYVRVCMYLIYLYRLILRQHGKSLNEKIYLL